MKGQKLSTENIRLIQEGNVDTAKSYLSFVDRDGRSPLFYSIIAGNTNMTDSLLTAGANVDLQDKNGWAPLHFAVQSYNLAAISLLLQNGANIEICDEHGNTPLWRAVMASQGKGGAITLLLDAGANPHSKNNSGISSYHLAKEIANYDIIKFF
ncbi:ankyrin repeat domain-containing protein [Dyadobacter sp. CY327]|uniref:ankyrin repeat domain-containing protein n=1 Tax=Dyadobacter sp. CY327 TaxID=2907301 RepID=UPI001F19D94E|nr:ankyrin repeat domain-containing protein [Dyadobacter sp. CY327]MCE7072521.1 ankyrin repeat domain-containing protein [Dyadobacter sp. CY327]